MPGTLTESAALLVEAGRARSERLPTHTGATLVEYRYRPWYPTCGRNSRYLTCGRWCYDWRILANCRFAHLRRWAGVSGGGSSLEFTRSDS